MDKLQNEVNLTLRETEICLAATDLVLFRPQSQSEPESLPPKDLRRVLAVVSHEYIEEFENHTVIPQREGWFVHRLHGITLSGMLIKHSLFIMKYKSQSFSELYPHLLFPIDSDLSLSLRQQEALNDTELELIITTPRGSIKLVSKDTQSLYYVLEECRRLQKLFDPYSNLFSTPLEHSEEDTEKKLDILLDEEHGDMEFENHWEWAHFYLNRRFSRIRSSTKDFPPPVPFIHPKPRDIRYLVNGHELSPIVSGTPGDEESDITIIRDHWAHKQLVKRKSEYSKERQLSLRIGNFNVNGKPPTDDLYSWIWGQERSGTLEEEPLLSDLLVFGFQEVDHSPETFIYTTTASAAKCTAWSEAIIKAMGQIAENYTQLISVQLAGVFVVMFLKKELKEHVSEVSSATAATGFLGFIANKGAAAIRLTLYSSTITFVCSHLAAFDDNAEKRDSDFNDLCRKLSFPLQWKGPRASQPAVATIWETDTLFWLFILGSIPSKQKLDLNYRIDLPDEEIRIHLLNYPDDMDDLRKNDQVGRLLSKKLEKAFVDFIESQITFVPCVNLVFSTLSIKLMTPRTYRFASGLLTDDLGYDMKRRPAWTDRILYRCADSVSVSQSSYEGHSGITQSDHRPVSANFCFSVLEIDTKLHHRTMKSIFQSLGDFEDSDETPNIELLGDPEISFGDLWYNNPSTKTLDLILPGESISIDLTITVNRLFAARLNLDSVLHKKSCFANSLSQLVTSKVPARYVENASPYPDKYHLNCPRELMLFIESADEETISAIREFLDTQPLDSATEVPFSDSLPRDKIAYAYSQTLLQFLNSLQDPIIPSGLYPRCAAVQSREDVFELIKLLPVAKVLANVFFREEAQPTPGIPHLTPLKRRDFIRYVNNQVFRHNIANIHSIRKDFEAPSDILGTPSD
ncbi:hypothetical protein Clacol_009067 [Clathrus columnatus]|uniref:Inositol polyphosphate-related phosphatase domain-containing protein n=1 Tax=Clathrus columnatus TaxID=1419009 RepID=A0AAV5AQ18_9AGAM|nr:hypothetical protein Clacol_009067 [Clathrus columnatus]